MRDAPVRKQKPRKNLFADVAANIRILRGLSRKLYSENWKNIRHSEHCYLIQIANQILFSAQARKRATLCAQNNKKVLD